MVGCELYDKNATFLSEDYLEKLTNTAVIFAQFKQKK